MRCAGGRGELYVHFAPMCPCLSDPQSLGNILGLFLSHHPGHCCGVTEKDQWLFFFRKNNYLLCTSTGLSKISSMKLDISGSTVWEKNQQPWPLQTSLRHMDGAAAVPAFSLVLKHARHCRTFAQAVLMLWMHVLCALSPHGLSQLLIGIWSRIIFITDITWHQSGSHWSSATYVSNTLCSWTVSCMQAQSHQG